MRPTAVGEDDTAATAPYSEQTSTVRNQFQKRNESSGKTFQGMKTDPPTVRSRLRKSCRV